MKNRYFISLAVLAIWSISSLAAHARETENGEQKFMVISGYGYSHYSENKSRGLGVTQSFIYTPSKNWGIGLDTGYEHAEGAYLFPVKNDNPSVIDSHTYDYFYIGPSIYVMPVNTRRHLVYFGGSLNYSHLRDSESYESYYPQNRKYVYDFSEKFRNGVGLVMNMGYTFKITGNIGVGVRAYCSSFEGYHVSGLINVCVAF